MSTTNGIINYTPHLEKTFVHEVRQVKVDSRDRRSLGLLSTHHHFGRLFTPIPKTHQPPDADRKQETISWHHCLDTMILTSIRFLLRKRGKKTADRARPEKSDRLISQKAKSIMDLKQAEFDIQLLLGRISAIAYDPLDPSLSDIPDAAKSYAGFLLGLVKRYTETDDEHEKKTLECVALYHLHLVFDGLVRNYRGKDARAKASEDPHRVYSPTGLVKGSVCLTIERRLTLILLVVNLKVYELSSTGRDNAGGKAWKEWDNDNDYGMSGDEVLCRDQMVLCGEGRLEAGVYEFGFELEFVQAGRMMGGLPSSLDFEKDSISYTISCILTRPTPVSATTICTSKISLLETIDIAYLPPPKP
ncbi:ph-response sensor protein [Rhizina undulata]